MVKNNTRHTQVYNNFKGVDYYHSPANVSAGRGVQGLNMVRSQLGKVEKRTGYYFEEKQWTDTVNGIHFLHRDTGDIKLVHSGDKFYVGDEVVHAGVNNHKSRSVQMGDSLYILDGASFMKFDGVSVTKVVDNPYVPLVYTGRSPDGTLGKSKEPANILTTKRCDGFVANGSSTIYYLSNAQLDSENVTAVIHKDDGSTETVTTGANLSVNRERGVVIFATPPPQSRNPDTDNVFITYEKSVADESPLEKCTVIGLFGPGGNPNTLFLSGNPDYPGREWYSNPAKPTFFGENNTDVALDSGSKVMGYSAKGDKLFVHRRTGGAHLNVLVRKCAGSDPDNYCYPVVNALDGPGALSSDTFVNMSRDALFLSEKGVYAVTEADADENHFAQLRSMYINPVLLKNQALENSTAVSYEDFYALAAGRDIFLLDTRQKSYEEDKGASRYQYECYHWQINEDIRLLFVENNQLCFVTQDGKTGRFYTDKTDPAGYNDNGNPIRAMWQTAYFTGGSVAKNKSVHRLWLVLEAANSTGVSVSGMFKGVWQKLFSERRTAGFFSWSGLNWAKFTWSCDTTPKLTDRDIKLKNIDKTSFLLENNRLNQPFGVYEIGVEYTE